MKVYVVVAPSAPGLLPEHRSLLDPFAELRAAAVSAAGWLAREAKQVGMLTDRDVHDGVEAAPLCDRVGRSLLRQAGFTEEIGVSGSGPRLEEGAGLLVVADGSARRSEKAPGHLDHRAFGLDDRIEKALDSGDLEVLRSLDESLAEELLAAGVPQLRRLGQALEGFHVVSSKVDYAADPYGVMYWVVRWVCES